MGRGKKNKGNSGPAPAQNVNKAKSPAVVKVVESVVTSTAAPLPVETDTSNDDLKVRLANAKERLHLLQEVIGGISDQADAENFKASSIDAAKEKLNIIQDSVNSVKTTLLEVKQEAARSVTPEGSLNGTNKKKKNKKHQNQNPPQGFVVRDQPASEVVETKKKNDASEHEVSALEQEQEQEQEDGNATISKKKRNRNKKNKGQQAQSSAPETLPQGTNAADEAVAVKNDKPPQTEAAPKESSPEANKSTNNKKNNKKGQQQSTNNNVESNTTADVESKTADPSKVAATEVKPNIQPPSNDKNKNKNKNKKTDGNNKDVEKTNEPTEDQTNKSKKQGDINIVESKIETSKNVSKDQPSTTKTKEDSLSKKEIQKKVETNNTKKENTKAKNDQKKDQKNDQKKDQKNDQKKDQKNDQKKDQKNDLTNDKNKEQKAEEKPTANNENVAPTEIFKAPEEEVNIKTQAESPKQDSSKNKKDTKKGQDSKPPPPAKVEEKQTEIKISTETSKLVAEAPKEVNVEATPKNEAKDANTQPPKTEQDKGGSQTGKPEEKIEKIITAPAPTEEKNTSASNTQNQQNQKNKKNKQPAPCKTVEKSDEGKPASDISSEKIVADISKTTDQLKSEETSDRVEKCNKNETGVATPVVIPKPEEKQKAVPPTAQTECRAVTDNKNETVKAEESVKPTVVEELTVKSKTEVPLATPALPKLDFSQVVKDNKDKIPLMEIKTVPVLAAEAIVETKAVDSVNKPLSETATTDKPIDEAIKAKEEDSPIKPAVDNKSAAEILPKLTADIKGNPTLNVVFSKPTTDATLTADEPPKTVVEPKIPVPEVETATCPIQNKAKTPERKGNQKNEQKKPQQVKGQCTKQNDQKPQATKKDEVKHCEVKKVATETKAITETKVVTETKNVPMKEQTKLDSPTIPSTEMKLKEEQVKQKAEEDTKGKNVPQKKMDTAEKQENVIQGKDINKKPVPAAVEAKVSGETQIKDNKGVSAQNTPTNTQKQEHKVELSKKDQKKQNKMKAKAPQPPDIPMDMSLLSASMIDPSAADEIISHEESEDQSSLITSDSKNVEGSDFVQSVNSSFNKAVADETKSLEAMPPKNDNEVHETEREAKNASPSSSKRNKDMANLKESVEMQETKRQELPEKSAQQKLEPVQFPAVKLLDILEAKMTSPTVKPGNIAGNVRKLPKDNKRADQLNVQQQKSRSKSPKENIAEKFVKNQKLASGDNKKQAAQNLKNEILKTEVGSVVTPINKEKEVKEPAKSDANLNESKSTSGTASITTDVSEAEQVGNLKESDAISKQAEPLPKNSTSSDTKPQQSNDDGKAATAVVDNKETVNTKPKIAPKPNVPTKNSPKANDRSKKSPPKTAETKTPGKESPVKEPATPLKSPAQAKQSKSPAKPTAQTKSQSKEPSKTAAPAKSSPSQAQASDAKSANSKKPEVPPKPDLSSKIPNKISPTPIQDEEEEFVEYRFSPRPVFIATACQICKVPLDIPNPCKLCQMVSYCSDEHQKEDQTSHVSLCAAIQEIAKKRGGHIYNNARILNDDDYRSLRVHTLNLCENFLKRHLLPFEREILLFPRLCCTGSCREWRQQSLVECKQCGQVSYCAAHPEHLPQLHEKWCQSFDLYQKIVLRQKNFGRIEPSLPSKIMLKPFDLSDNIDNVFKILYKNYGAIKDECIYATLTQLATAPLTALYGAQKNQQEIGETYTIHLVGAELQFEADTLDKWEAFFLHLVPILVELRVVFVGPELNAENLPLEILSRIRMCRTCRQNCRIVKFDFQCGILYHDYANSSAFMKPDLICFFNPGLYRSTGFNGLDTWPKTIKSAAAMNCPIVVTSYTEIESPRDLDRIQKESDRPLSVVQSPQINAFSSQRPERNFISDEIAPMIFKNFFCFCVK